MFAKVLLLLLLSFYFLADAKIILENENIVRLRKLLNDKNEFDEYGIRNLITCTFWNDTQSVNETIIYQIEQDFDVKLKTFENWNHSVCQIEDIHDEENLFGEIFIVALGENSNIPTVYSGLENETVLTSRFNISNGNFRFIDLRSNGKVMYMKENFCYDRLRNYVYKITQCNTTKYCIVQTDEISSTNESSTILFSSENFLSHLLCFSQYGLVLFTEKNGTEYRLKNIKLKYSSINSSTLQLPHWNISLISPVVAVDNSDSDSGNGPSVIVLTHTGVCKLHLFEFNTDRCFRVSKNIHVENITQIASTKNFIYFYNILDGLSRVERENDTIQTITWDKHFERVSDLKIFPANEIQNINLLFTRCELAITSCELQSSKSSISVTTAWNSCNNFSQLPIIFSVDAHCSNSTNSDLQIKFFEEIRTRQNNITFNIWKTEWNSNCTYVVNAKIHNCPRCPSVRTTLNSTTNVGDDDDKDSSWLIGAISALLLVILIQVSWLLRHKYRAKSDLDMFLLKRIRNDKIEWTSLIDSGNFGEVWKGKLTLDNGETIPVALKQPKGKKARQYLLEEAILLSHLDHGNIIQVKGLCMHANHSATFDEEQILNRKAFENSKYNPVLVFEYMNGKNCQHYIVDHFKTVTSNELRKIATDIIEALVYLETNHYIHRDIALRNVLLKIDVNSGFIETAKLADFGLAKDVVGEDSHTYERMNAPFPDRSTAPEGLSRGEFTIKSDVWAYGVLLWEMFTTWETGEKSIPYADVHDFWMLRYHICEEGKILSRPNFCTTNLYENVLKSTWSYDQADRPSFVDLKETLLENWPDLKLNASVSTVRPENVYKKISSTKPKVTRQFSRSRSERRKKSRHLTVKKQLNNVIQKNPVELLSYVNASESKHSNKKFEGVHKLSAPAGICNISYRSSDSNNDTLSGIQSKSSIVPPIAEKVAPQFNAKRKRVKSAAVENVEYFSSGTSDDCSYILSNSRQVSFEDRSPVFSNSSYLCHNLSPGDGNVDETDNYCDDASSRKSSQLSQFPTSPILKKDNLFVSAKQLP